MRDHEEAAYTTMSRALLAGLLTPGTPLRETALAEVFGISRERIRKILQRLGTNRLIELVPNRGAFVAAPSLEQARSIYEARRILEGGIVGHLASSMGPTTMDQLKDHLAAEADALRRGDRAESVRLSAQFHMILAEATGNVFIMQQMQELVSRTSMLVAVYETANASQCACEEHRDIFTSLIGGDGAGAAKAMRAHLSLIETRLRPGAVAPGREATEMLKELWAAEQITPDRSTEKSP
ncbi:MAG: transcriptional regulator, GntR family [Rhodoferax sp.]|nr:transcriptional regulator, GntR family [Rhodoferax sp.]